MEVVAPYKVSDLKPDAEGHWPPPFEFNGKPCLLIRTPSGDVRAFNAICTHVACTVSYRAAEGDIFCNCHNGVYNLNGQNVSGPPPRPLQEYKVTTRPSQTPGQEEIVVSRST
jgi:Rieske Fe-S protein